MACTKALKQLLELRVVQDLGRKAELTSAISDHAADCEECRAFVDGVRSDVELPSMKLSRKAGYAASPNHFQSGGIGMSQQQGVATEAKGKFFTLFVDGKEFHVDRPELTGAEIMDLGGIAHDVGLILVEEDGTQIQIRETDVVELKPGRRFKKAPRFIRG